MNRATIQLKLNLDSPLGKQVFASLVGAIGGVDVKMEVVKDKTEEVAVAETTTEAPKKKRATTAPAVLAEAVEANVEETKAPKEVEGETGIALGDIKAEIAKKVSKHRIAIKAKLTEFEVPNSDQLGKDKYAEFHEFLMSLE